MGEELALSEDQIKSITEQRDQVFYASMVVMFRVLKTVRIQDAIGNDPQSRYLFAVACIAVANQCESNIPVQPLYLKSLSKATFIAQNYAELVISQNGDTDGLLSFEQWKEGHLDHIIQMHNSIM